MPIYDCSAPCNSVLLQSCAVSLLPLRDDCTSPARTTTLLALSTSHTATVARSVDSTTGTASQSSPGRLRSTSRIARVQP